jgi:hypothetical protein
MCSLAELIANLEQAASAVAEALATNEHTQHLSDDELHHGVVSLQKSASIVAVASARALQPWHERSAWVRSGHLSAARCLARAAHLSTRSARRELRRAHQLSKMPGTQQAILAGQLSIDHADLFGRANQSWRSELFREHEPTLVDQCARLHWEPATRVVQYWAQHADAITEQPPPPVPSAHCWAADTPDGIVHLQATLDPIGGEIVTNELRRLEQQLRSLDHQHGITRTAGQRRAAALVEMAARSASTPQGAQRPRPLFTVIVGDATAAHLCQLASGTVMHAAHVAPHLAEALLESVCFDGLRNVVAVSPQRTFTGLMRRAVIARDRFCTHPSGCDVPAQQCDIDHVQPWSHGGLTTITNATARCATHNRLAQQLVGAGAGPPDTS